MTIHTIQCSFVRGELSPKLRGRVDIEQYGQGAADLTNWLVTPQGGIERRPGSLFIGALRDETEQARLIEFEFNDEQAYCICLNDSFTRFFTLGAAVVQAAQSISGITKANPAVVTYVGADNYANNDKILITGVLGMTEVNNREFTVSGINTGTNTFQLLNVNSTSYTTYVSGGAVTEIVEVDDGWTEARIFDIQYTQAGDTIYMTNGHSGNNSIQANKLVRTSETVWTQSDLLFEDGPYLEEDTQGTTMTPASTGSVVDVDMTANATSSYTAADSATSANAYLVFDRSLSTSLTIAATTGWVSIDFPAATTKIADAYWLAASAAAPELMPTHWTVEGWNGSAWVVVDARAGETVWAAGERRYYEFPNATAYLGYRLQWYAVDGGATTSIAEWVIHQEGANQTAFNLTASSVTGINGGAGFNNGDASNERSIRLMGSDGRWRWARIIAYTSTTVVTIKLYGPHALLDTGPINRWQLGSFSNLVNPNSIGFYQERLMLGGTPVEPRTVWGSESANYEVHSVTHIPIETDAIAVGMTGNQLSKINWIEELGEMIVGTGGGIRTVGPATQAEPFSSFNVQSRKISSIGASTAQPIVTDDALLYLDRYNKRLIALRYSNEGGGYVPSNISWWSDHLFSPGIVEMAFQEDRDNVAWFVDVNGKLIAGTYNPEFGAVAFTPMEMGGSFSSGSAVVGSVAAIPSAGRAGVYLIVKRTINGATRRYVEYLAHRYDPEAGDLLTNAVYFDCAFTYSGSSTSTITGLTWLIGETIGVLIDGVDQGDVVVNSSGTITLPVAGTKVTGGLRYTSRLETLRAPTTGNKDGSSMGRQLAVKSVALDLLNAKGLEVGTLNEDTTDVFPHPDRDAADGLLNTGVFRNVPVTDNHDNDGVVVITTDRGYPATIRSVIVGLDGSP